MCVRCQVDLSMLCKEHTHKLELMLEEGKGTLVLLVTLTASAAVSISDMSVNFLDDPQERQNLLNRYVSISVVPPIRTTQTGGKCQRKHKVLACIILYGADRPLSVISKNGLDEHLMI